MAETLTTIGYGSIFAVSTDGGSTYVDIAEVNDITPPSSTFDMVDATHMQSPNSDREFIIGLNDPGEMSLTMNFVPGSASDTKIQAIKQARARVKCRITFPNGVTWTFSGLLMTYEPAVPTDDKMTATVTFKVSGSTVTGSADAPVNSVLPAISGLLTAGAVLTAYEGVWSGSPIFTYQWKKAGTNIAGATSKTYTIVGGDSGAALTVAVTGTNSAGNATATSAPVTAA